MYIQIIHGISTYAYMYIYTYPGGGPPPNRCCREATPVSEVLLAGSSQGLHLEAARKLRKSGLLFRVEGVRVYRDVAFRGLGF